MIAFNAFVAGVSALLGSVAPVAQANPTKVAEKPDAPAVVTYKNYHNDKYGYSIDYPSFLTPQGEPDAQDGQIFSSPKSPLKMKVWGVVFELAVGRRHVGGRTAQMDVAKSFRK